MTGDKLCVWLFEEAGRMLGRHIRALSGQYITDIRFIPQLYFRRGQSPTIPGPRWTTRGLRWLSLEIMAVAQKRLPPRNQR